MQWELPRQEASQCATGDPLPTIADHYRPLLAIADHYRPLPTIADQCQQLPTIANHYQPSTTITNGECRRVAKFPILPLVSAVT